MKFDNSKLNIPLDSLELEGLNYIFEDIDLSVSFLHGYFCAMIAAPTVILPSQWQPRLFFDFDFESNEQAQQVIELVLRFYNQTVTQLRDGDFKPFLHKGINNGLDYLELIQDWSVGYLDGIDLDPIWSMLEEEDDYMRLLLLPLIAVVEYLDFPEDVSTNEESTRDIVEVIEDVNKSFYENWKKMKQSYPNNMMAFNKGIIRTRTQGRNEPCACGSGKKYKKCCLNAAEVLH